MGKHHYHNKVIDQECSQIHGECTACENL